ncbi:Nephrocystin-3, partial [Termitomyces sp. J132]
DDGGIRGLSGLYILQEIMFRLMHLENTQIMPKPCDYFDIIGGVGTGGVIALMLGRLGMTIDQAIKEYASFSKNVYSNVKTWSTSQEKFKASIFVSEMEKILISAGFPIDISMQDHTFCRSFVVALPSAHMTPRIFRTYQVRANPGYNCTVVEAARATTATPELFKPVVITAQGVSETFVGARLGYSNPTSVVLDEAKLVFGLSQEVICLVSIGAGHPGPVLWNPTKHFNKRLVNLLFQISTNYEAPAEELVKRYLHLPGVFYRLSVEQGLQGIVDDYNQLGVIKAHSLDYLKKAEVSQKVDDLVHALHDCSPKVTLGVLMGHVSPEQISPGVSLLPIVPAPSSLFTGRKDILNLLKKYFSDDEPSLKTRTQKCFVLHGLGGTGKTQIALQFVHKFRSRFSSTYMIDASSKTTIEQFFKLLAQDANLTDATSTGVLTWLCYQQEEWLMIFDNANDPDVNLQENEASKFYAHGNCYKTAEMSEKDSLKIFYKASLRKNELESEHNAAIELVHELNYLALAIVQAAGYLFYNKYIQISEYLENYRKDKPRYLAEIIRQKMDHYNLSVFATWDLSYQKLNERAKQILMICGVLHNSKIPVSILKKAYESLSSNLGLEMNELQNLLQSLVGKDQIWDEKLMEEGVKMLRSYSLVEISGKETLYIHPLVHEWAYKSLSKDEQTRAQKCAQQIFCLAITLYLIGQLKEARELMQHVFEVRTKAFGINHLDTIKAAGDLAVILYSSGKIEESKELEEQVLKFRTETFGSNHPDTILAMGNLASSLSASGQFEEAEKLQQQVLKARIEAFGTNHPDTIQAMNNLAVTFHSSRQLEQAQELMQQVLEARKEAFGSGHPDTIEAMANLAAVLAGSGQLGQDEQAKELRQQVLKLRTEAFGSRHPLTIEAMASLAVSLKTSGHLEEGKKLEQQVLEARTEIFGSSHPDTIQAMAYLAMTLHAIGQLEEAKKLKQHVLNIRTEAFGINHPDTIQAKATLAATLRSMEQFEETMELEQQVLKLRTEAFGSTHPLTIKAKADLAVTFHSSGQLEEAKELKEQVLEVTKKTFGSGHPDTIEAMAQFAAILHSCGQLEQARELKEQVLKVRKEALGSNHPLTVEAMATLAVTLYAGKQLEQAKELMQYALKVRREMYGSSHPETITTMSVLAAIFSSCGQLEQARELQEQVLKIKKEAFGSDHPFTIQAMATLAITLHSSRQFEQAKELMQYVLKVRTEIFGSSHPDTILTMTVFAGFLDSTGQTEEAMELRQQVQKAKMEMQSRAEHKA